MTAQSEPARERAELYRATPLRRISRLHGVWSMGILLAAAGCGNSEAPTKAASCDQACRDGTALRAVRETLKLIYNLTLQGKPVGDHNVTTPCPQGGTARVFGRATSNAVQGATEVELFYLLEDCTYLQKDDEAEQNYSLVLTGVLLQWGTIAVQPSASTALFITSQSMTLSGTVYDPPLDYEEKDCAIDVVQNGKRVTGLVCDRVTGVNL